MKRIKCPECNKIFKSDSAYIRRESSDMGVYYEGVPICEKCGIDKYEDARAEYEAFGTLKLKTPTGF